MNERRNTLALAKGQARWDNMVPSYEGDLTEAEYDALVEQMEEDNSTKKWKGP